MRLTFWFEFLCEREIFFVEKFYLWGSWYEVWELITFFGMLLIFNYQILQTLEHLMVISSFLWLLLNWNVYLWLTIWSSRLLYWLFNRFFHLFFLYRFRFRLNLLFLRQHLKAILCSKLLQPLLVQQSTITRYVILKYSLNSQWVIISF